MRVREREIRDAELTQEDMDRLHDLFETWNLRLNRYHKGTQRAGWYVTGVRNSTLHDGAFWGKLKVDLANAAADPESVREKWLEYAENSGADIREDLCLAAS